MSRTRLAILATATVAALALAGCGGGTETTPTPAAGSSSTAPAAEQRVEIDVAGGQVQGGLRSVPVAIGTPVVLVVRSDRADEAHLHGYDRKIELAPGQTGTISFTADKAGVFALELHGADLQLARIEVS